VKVSSGVESVNTEECNLGGKQFESEKGIWDRKSYFTE
jgi:hypothetical protein